MKRIFLVMALILVVGTVSAQVSTTFDQVYRNNGTGAAGSTWARSATHYTEYIDMKDVDSARIVVDFPDSVDVGIYVENYASKDGVVKLSSLVNSDSTIYTTDGVGISKSYTLTDLYDQGFPIIRIKSVFSAIKNGVNGSEKYRYYIKRFRHK